MAYEDGVKAIEKFRENTQVFTDVAIDNAKKVLKSIYSVFPKFDDLQEDKIAGRMNWCIVNTMENKEGILVEFSKWEGVFSFYCKNNGLFSFNQVMRTHHNVEYDEKDVHFTEKQIQKILQRKQLPRKSC